MWRGFHRRRGYDTVGYRRRGIGMSYAGTVLLVSIGVLLLLYLLGYL